MTEKTKMSVMDTRSMNATVHIISILPSWENHTLIDDQTKIYLWLLTFFDSFIFAVRTPFPRSSNEICSCKSVTFVNCQTVTFNRFISVEGAFVFKTWHKLFPTWKQYRVNYVKKKRSVVMTCVQQLWIKNLAEYKILQRKMKKKKKMKMLHSSACICMMKSEFSIEAWNRFLRGLGEMPCVAFSTNMNPVTCHIPPCGKRRNYRPSEASSWRVTETKLFYINSN